MPDIGNLSEFLPFLLTSAGMVFWATVVSIALRHLRQSDPYEDYSPLVERAAEWVRGLSALSMQLLSLAAFFVPLLLVSLVLLLVPADAIEKLEPYATGVVLALLAYTGQQWVYERNR